MADMVASQIHMISTHTGDVTCLAFAHGTLATTSGDKSVRLWSTKDFTELPCSPLLGHSYTINYCTFSPLGSTLATCSTDGKLILWDVKSGEVTAQFEHDSKSSIRVCKFSPDSSRIASGSDDDTICIWEIATKKIMRSFTGLEDSVIALAYSPDGHFLVSGSTNGDIHAWDAEFGHGRYLSLKVDAHDLGVTCCEFSPTFGSANRTNTVVASLLLASGGKDHLIKLWTFKAQVGSAEVLLKCHASLPGHSDTVMSCAFSPSGEILASGSFDKTVRMWDPLKGVALFYIEDCHNRFVTCCAFSLDGSLLATGSMDRTVKIWQLTDTSQIMYGLKGYEEPEVEETAPVEVTHPMQGFTVEDVVQWLSILGLTQYRDSFISNAIDGKELLALTMSDLETHLGVAALGHRNKILRSRDQAVIPTPEEAAPAPVSVRTPKVKVVAGAGEGVCWNFTGAPTGKPDPSQSGNKQVATPALQINANSRPSPQWTVENVVQWLGALGLSIYQDSFRRHSIDGTELFSLNASDLNTILGVDAANGHSEYFCPITMEVMKDPVIAADGYTYDRSAIQAWLEKGKERSPMTNAVLAHKSLTPNRTLKMLIQRHLEQGGK